MVLPFKDKELSKVAAFFNLSTFLLTCGALVQPNWFKIRGARCLQQHLSLSQFFAFDDDDDDEVMPSSNFDFGQPYEPKVLPPCTTSEIITLMRVLILLCFMVLMCSFIGVLINLTSVTSKPLKMLRRNAIPSIMCVFWVIAIVGVCYYTTVILGSGNNDAPAIQVDYEYGFYMITAAGSLSLMASAANLWGAPMTAEEDIQRRNLIEDWDGYDPHGVGPTPAVPSLPPYTPYTTDFNPAHTLSPAHLPPNLGSQQYFPFDDLSVLPPPPPYTP